MSGGVDSSVAALMLLREGYECVGCTMRLFENDLIGEDLLSGCCSARDTGDARAVCERLGMEHRVLHYEREFIEHVVEPFACAYEAGETPNPCIDCNRYLKFDRLYEEAMAMGCDTLATGHYARIERRAADGRLVLKKARDVTKDQSYVLYNLTEQELAHMRFPLGELTKEEVRRIADSEGFINAHKHDSQDICFVPDGDYAGMLARYRGSSYPEGPIVDEEGHVLGTHRGIVGYTRGQRRGLGIASSGRLYVNRVDAASNTVVLSDDAALWEKEVSLKDFHWITGEFPQEPFTCRVRIRYRHREAPATVAPVGGGRARVSFLEPQRAPTPGQAAVCYDGDMVLGGGIICSPE